MSSHSTGFSTRVRALRVASGQTQGELAEAAGISERTVSDLERGLRTRVYPATARQLAAALGVSNEGLAAFLIDAGGIHEPGGSTSAQVVMPPTPNRFALPRPLTRLVGRDAELTMVLGLVDDPAERLMTLVGPGGVGKTRLAVEVATRSEERFPSGSYFVDLSTITDPDMVIPSLAAAVGLQPDAGDLALALAQRLGEARALVVLDTFEHLVVAASAVGQLIGACPSLTVLATSRESLRVRGEREIPLPPLAARTSGAAGEELAPAVELFLERARAVLPHLSIAPEDIEIVSDICARLDGLPLAIELAAARVKHLPLSDLRRHLDHRLDALVGGARDLPPRHQTMRGTLDWSYARLAASEMRMFRGLSVFRGGFGAEAARVVTTTKGHGSDDVLATLSTLVDCSLAQADADASGIARYRLLDVVRDYGTERAVAAGELDQLRRRHAAHFLALAERAEPELRGSEQRDWYARLLDDEGNLRAALTWALEVGEAEIALRLAGALWMFWRWAGLFVEGRRWLDAALAAEEECSPAVRQQALWGAGWLAYHQGDYRRSGEVGQEMLRLLGGADEPLQWRNALTLVGNAALAEGRPDDAVRALGHAVVLCEDMGTSWHLATSLLNLGTALLHVGRTEEAEPPFERAEAIYAGIGDRHFAARALIKRGYAHLLAGDLAAAVDPMRRGMQMCAEIGDSWGIAEGLEAVATLRSESDPRSAVLLAGAAEKLRDRISMRPHPADARINRIYLDLARKRLTPEEFERAWVAGRGTALGSILAFALEPGTGEAPDEA